MVDSLHTAGSSNLDDALLLAAAREATDLAAQLAQLRQRAGIAAGRADLPQDMFADYEVVAELDRGGQGVVYRGVHKRTHRAVAIKVLREGPFAGPRDRARFEREVEILRQIDHPNVVAIRDCGVAAGRQYLVTDFIDGTPLDEWTADCGPALDATGRCQGLRIVDCTVRSARQDAIDALLGLFEQICDAVNAAHLIGVIHRDLKPSNILIDSAGQPHVLDFGLAKIATVDARADVSAAGTGIPSGSFAPAIRLEPESLPVPSLQQSGWNRNPFRFLRSSNPQYDRDRSVHRLAALVRP